MPSARQLVDLREQRLRIDDHAVADDAGDAVVQDAGRDQVQDELLAADVDRVAGVVPALVARHAREVRRQQVDDLALAFVAPLRAENGDVHRLYSILDACSSTPRSRITSTCDGSSAIDRA